METPFKIYCLKVVDSVDFESGETEIDSRAFSTKDKLYTYLDKVYPGYYFTQDLRWIGSEHLDKMSDEQIEMIRIYKDFQKPDACTDRSLTCYILEVE